MAALPGVRLTAAKPQVRRPSSGRLAGVVAVTLAAWWSRRTRGAVALTTHRDCQPSRASGAFAVCGSGGNGNPDSLVTYGGGSRAWWEAVATTSWALVERSAGWLLRRRKQYRILVLFSDTGGGHRASALAIAQALDNLYPGSFEVVLLDIWTSAGVWPLNRFESLYRYLGRRPWLWRALWYATANYFTRGPIRTAHDVQHRHRFAEAMKAAGPVDAVLSVHPLCQHVPLSAMRNVLRWTQTPFVTLVTDLGSAHPMWFDSRADHVFVPNERVARLAKFHGVPSAKITAHGLPLRADFFARMGNSRRQHRDMRLAELNTGNRPANVLIVGGGDGVGKLDRLVDAIVRALRRRAQRTMLTVVCGRNAELRQALTKSFASEARDGTVQVVVHGFVTNMHILMTNADCIVTKAGPGTIAEAASLGLPIMITSFLPGQERGNARLVVDQGFGTLERRPSRAASLLCDWLNNPAKLAAMSTRAFDASSPDSTTKIARDLAHIVYSAANQHQLDAAYNDQPHFLQQSTHAPTRLITSS